MVYDGLSWILVVYGLSFDIMEFMAHQFYHGIHGLSVCHCLSWFMQFMMLHIVEVV